MGGWGGGRAVSCLPEVLRAEGSVQVRVHVSAALLHRPRVGDERPGFQPFPLDLGVVLDPQVHQGHARHLVPVRSAEYSHPPGRVEAQAAAGGRHGCAGGGALLQAGGEWGKKFPAGAPSAALFLNARRRGALA